MTNSNDRQQPIGRHAAPAHMQPSQHQGSSKNGKRRSAPLIIILILCLLVALGTGGYLVSQFLQSSKQAEKQADTPKPETTVEDEMEDNPIDFASLQAENPDIYAWIYIPDTNVNLPILQSSVDDNYYLRRDQDGNDSLWGAIYTQSMNAKDFSDPVTVMYGHTTGNGSMFDDLHKFEDADFFDSHPDMYIYTPGHILQYRIISAYVYDDRHIMNSFDFSDEQVRTTYFNSVLNPTSMTKNVRDGATLDADSKIVQLSTCLSATSTAPNRFIVTGVLLNDQPTK